MSACRVGWRQGEEDKREQPRFWQFHANERLGATRAHASRDPPAPSAPCTRKPVVTTAARAFCKCAQACPALSRYRARAPPSARFFVTTQAAAQPPSKSWLVCKNGRSAGGMFIVQRRPGRQLTERRRTCSTWRGCRVALGGAGTRAGFVRGRQGQLLRRFQQTHKRETPTRRARSWEASAPTRILQGSIMYTTSARRTPRAPSGEKQCVARRCGEKHVRHTPFQQEVGLWMPLCFEFDFLGFHFCRGASPRRRFHRCQCDGQPVQAWTPWVSTKESHLCMGSRGAARGRAPVPRGTLWLSMPRTAGWCLHFVL